MILISCKFEISSSFSRISINSITLRKADSIIELSYCVILIGCASVVQGRERRVLRDTSPILKAPRVLELGIATPMISLVLQVLRLLHLDRVPHVDGGAIGNGEAGPKKKLHCPKT
jgi:hypothetical protein